MAEIKTTRIRALMPDSRNDVLGAYWRDYTFKTFVDDKGGKVYLLNDDEIDKDAGNDRYLDVVRRCREMERTDSVERISYEALIERLEAGIDRYAEYIDDYGQYLAAQAHNAKMMERIGYIKALMAGREAS